MAGFSRARRVLVLGSLTLACLGCEKLGTRGVRLSALATSADEPSNVAVYVGVTDQGEPVTDLDATSFGIYENGRLLEPRSIRTTLLPREVVTSEQVVLLVDLSGELSDAQRASYAQAVEAFVRKLQTTLSVTVLAFSGEESLKTIGEYERAANPLDAPAPSAASLAKLSTPDSSRNLHGAVLAGLDELEAKLNAEGKPVHLGTLVVFARGPDLAGRVTERELLEAIEARASGIVGIGVGDEVPYLDFAKNGVFRAGDPESIPNAIPIAFEEAAARVMKAYRKYYLVSYCSPARSGTNQVRVEVVRKTETGEEHRGDTFFDFDATGFAAGCDPGTAPRFRR